METEIFRSRKIRLPTSQITSSREEKDFLAVQSNGTYYIDYQIEGKCPVRVGDRIIRSAELVKLVQGELNPEEIESFNMVAPEVIELVLLGALADKESFQRLPEFMQQFILTKVMPFLYQNYFGAALLETYTKIIPPENQQFNHLAVCLLSQLVHEDVENNIVDPAEHYLTGLNAKKYYDSSTDMPINCVLGSQQGEKISHERIARKRCVYKRNASYSTIPDPKQE